MHAADLFSLLRTQPFTPFRLYATDGRTYDVRHPDQALVLQTRVVLPMPADAEVPNGLEHLALSHIIRAEELPSARSRSTG